MTQQKKIVEDTPPNKRRIDCYSRIKDFKFYHQCDEDHLIIISKRMSFSLKAENSQKY
jgi:hypothetical protein